MGGNLVYISIMAGIFLKIFPFGRPPLSTGKKKAYRINLNLETADYYNLLGKMRNAGIRHKSDFVRECIRNACVKARLSVEQLDLIRKLCGMVNNLNQLTLLAHVQGFVEVRNECFSLAKKIDIF